MKLFVKKYFIHLLKPSLMTTAFAVNCAYLNNSKFVNTFYFYIYLLTVMLKPLFLLFILAIGIKRKNIKNFQDFVTALIVLISINFGFPIKEYYDILNILYLKDLFQNKEYNVEEYILSHFIINLLLESIPVLLFCIINNMFLGWSKTLEYCPIIFNFNVIIFHLLYFLV